MKYYPELFCFDKGMRSRAGGMDTVYILRTYMGIDVRDRGNIGGWEWDCGDDKTYIESSP